MAKFRCEVSFEETIEAEDESDAEEKFLDLIDSLDGSWVKDNTIINEEE